MDMREENGGSGIGIEGSGSLRDIIEQADPETLGMIIDRYGDIDTYVDSIDNREAAGCLWKEINRLSQEDQKVMALRFGLLDGKTRTLEEMTQITGKTREQIRHIEDRAFRRGCFYPIRRKKLKDHLDDN